MFDQLDEGTRKSNPTEPGQFITDKELQANQRYKTFNPLIPDYENFAAYGQSGGKRIGNALDNLVEKTGAYIVQNAGFIGGAPFALGGWNISNMTDNFLTQIGDAWKAAVQERSPIYKTDKYTQGNIWSKLGTTSWWLDDAIDRVALTGAMLIPGIAESRGLFGLSGITNERGRSNRSIWYYS